MKLCAIVTAAGQGKRYGGPKVFGIRDGAVFHEIIADKLQSHDIDTVWVVSGENISNELKKFPVHQSDIFAYNTNPSSDMFASILAATQFVSAHYTHIMLWPVDFPDVTEESINKIIASFTSEKNHYDVIKPFCDNKGGHPVIFSKRAFTLAVSTNSGGGLRDYFRNSRPITIAVQTKSDVLRNINFKTREK
ncbi:MAG: NTP transferase domain-containing protein [Deltaproteobacteria bacterium]|nr:NTP transferase domain-containing protein [Deltaproteobacteria bacterium]